MPSVQREQQSESDRVRDQERVKRVLDGSQDAFREIYDASALCSHEVDSISQRPLRHPRPARKSGNARSEPIVVSNVVSFGPFERAISRSYA